MLRRSNQGPTSALRMPTGPACCLDADQRCQKLLAKCSSLVPCALRDWSLPKHIIADLFEINDVQAAPAGTSISCDKDLDRGPNLNHCM